MQSELGVRWREDSKSQERSARINKTRWLPSRSEEEEVAVEPREVDGDDEEPHEADNDDEEPCEVDDDNDKEPHEVIEDDEEGPSEVINEKEEPREVVEDDVEPGELSG